MASIKFGVFLKFFVTNYIKALPINRNKKIDK
jgi:hypothetical protein